MISLCSKDIRHDIHLFFTTKNPNYQAEEFQHKLLLIETVCDAITILGFIATLLGIIGVSIFYVAVIISINQSVFSFFSLWGASEILWKIHRVVHNFSDIFPMYDKMFTTMLTKTVCTYIKFTHFSIKYLAKNMFNYVFHYKEANSIAQILNNLRKVAKTIFSETLKLLLAPKKCEGVFNSGEFLKPIK